MVVEAQVEKKTLVSYNPADESVVGEVAIAGVDEVRAAVERARGAQVEWNALGLRGRLKVIRRFQQVLHAQKQRVGELITREAGKPVVEALLSEVLVVLDS